MINLPLLKNAKDITGKRVIVRIDVNVPIENGEVTDDFRIRRILPTLTYLKEKAARVILIGHHSYESQTLEPVARHLNRFIKTSFVRDIFNKNLYTEKDTFFLCENLRFFKEEKENDTAFAKKLASLGNVYINEAFSVSHRAHASIISIPKFLPSYAGLLFEEEITHLEMAFNPPRPSLFILGGIKASTKLPLALKFIDTADNIFIGGAVVNNILKQQGYEVGRSIIDEAHIDCKKLILSEKVIMPLDVIVQNKKGEKSVKKPTEVLPDEKMLDAGPETMSYLAGLISKSAFVVWNGPLGDYEHGFEKSTIELINAFTKSKAKTLIGGGDTIAAISRFGREDHFGFISTGGGAMLQFLLDRTLPGIEALRVADTRGVNARLRRGFGGQAE
ncbi:MAG: phosphoglycerate kinase [bacterium]|nr:phosphoglycerate kinase [bacterium]